MAKNLSNKIQNIGISMNVKNINLKKIFFKKFNYIKLMIKNIYIYIFVNPMT